MKRFISGFLLGALIFSVPALANNSKNIEAFYNNIKIKVYGQLVNTEGNEPFIVGGRTYVPARYVAEAMGGKVNWNAETNTVEILKGAVAGISMFTSDGLKAINSNGQYLIQIADIVERYGLTYAVTDDWKTMTFFKKDKTSLSFALERLNGTAAVSVDEYEKTILPFIMSE